MPTETDDFGTVNHGWWVYYGINRFDGRYVFLFNIKADNQLDALRKGHAMYTAYPPDNIIRRLYSRAKTMVRPLNREQADLLESKEMGR